jgi:hypothetical protein
MDCRSADDRLPLFSYRSTAKLGRIIVGRMLVVLGPQTTRNGVVAIDSFTARSCVAGDCSQASTSNDMSRYGMMLSCAGGHRSTQRDQKACGQGRVFHSPINHSCRDGTNNGDGTDCDPGLKNQRVG